MPNPGPLSQIIYDCYLVNLAFFCSGPLEISLVTLGLKKLVSSHNGVSQLTARTHLCDHFPAKQKFTIKEMVTRQATSIISYYQSVYHCRLSNPSNEFMFMDAQYSSFLLVARLNQGRTTGYWNIWIFLISTNLQRYLNCDSFNWLFLSKDGFVNHIPANEYW